MAHTHIRSSGDSLTTQLSSGYDCWTSRNDKYPVFARVFYGVFHGTLTTTAPRMYHSSGPRSWKSVFQQNSGSGNFSSSLERCRLFDLFRASHLATGIFLNTTATADVSPIPVSLMTCD